MLTVIGIATIQLPLRTNNESTTEGHVAVAKLLLSHGARCDARDLFGKTILHYAIGPLYKLSTQTKSENILQIAVLCLEHATRINICNPRFVDYRDRFGSVALVMAIQLNIELLVKILCVKHHADITLKDVDDFSPLDAAAHFPAFRRIMEKVCLLFVLPSFSYSPDTRHFSS